MKGKKEEEKGNENGDVKAGEKLKTKEYDKELAKLHVELVKLQEWVKFKRLKVCVVFEGRAVPARGDDQGHHRAGQPSGVSRGGASRPDG